MVTQQEGFKGRRDNNMVIKRIQDKIDNNLGTIRPKDSQARGRRWRSDTLKKYDDYFNSKQYEGKIDWHQAVGSTPFVGIKDRKPFITYPLPKIVVNRLKTKLAGEKNFPTLTIPEDPDTAQLIKLIHKISDFQAAILKLCEYLLTFGSAFARFHFVQGRLRLDCYNPNNCYPIFDKNEELEEIEIRFVYDEIVEGKKKQFWYRLFLGKNEDIIFDNPEYKAGTIPEFKVVERNEHGLNFVQGEWAKTTKNPLAPDGECVFKDVLDFTDCLSYLMTMSHDGAIYNIDPQLVLKGLSTDEFDDIVKTKEKAWTLGRDGEANFVETTGSGIATALEIEKSTMQRVQDITRVIMHDPEKFSAHAQSGKAMEILNGPMTELIAEIRTYLQKFITTVTIKMLSIFVMYSRQGFATEIEISPKYRPISLEIEVNWPPIFAMTTQDLQQMVTLYTSLTSANIMSRQTALEKMAQYFDIEDIEAEQQKINTQPQFNTWGF